MSLHFLMHLQLNYKYSLKFGQWTPIGFIEVILKIISKDDWWFASCMFSMVCSSDVHETFWAKTETRPMSPRPRRSKFYPRRDVAASETLAETLKLPRVSGALRSRPASRKLQRLVSDFKRFVSDKILNVSVSSRSRVRRSRAHPCEDRGPSSYCLS